MKINNEFTVGASIQQAWDTMLNLERIAPCLPGAAIQEEKDEGEYDGTMKVKIGPITANYKGTVKFEEVDCFGGVAIGFGPRLCDFVNHPCRELVFALPHQRGDAKQQVNTLLRRNVTPRLERLCGSLDRFVRQFFRRFVKLPDYLGPVGRIDAVECVARVDAFAADHERVFPA